MSESGESRYNPRWHGPKEIVPELNTPMVDLAGNFIGTWGQIMERNKYPNDGTALAEATKEKPAHDRIWRAKQEREAAENRAAQAVAYAEYERREGHPHPLFAGAVATAAAVERPVASAQEHASAPAPAREAALVY